MSTASIRAKLHDYLDRADENTLRAIFTQFEPEITSSEWWNDKTVVKELDRRSADLASGKDTGMPWEQVKTNILTSKVK